jgi:hypothetical protein
MTSSHPIAPGHTQDLTNEQWQTQARGTKAQEYEIYCAAAADLGWPLKTFEQWLCS